MMKQYMELKKNHPHEILLFRCGDFYETFNEDAELCANILGITLTKRNAKVGRKFTQQPMAGFPHHAIDTYLPKLIRAGHRVAICDQIEDPKKVRHITKRETTEETNPKEETKDIKNVLKDILDPLDQLKENYEKEIKEIKDAAMSKDIEIAVATVKALGSNIPQQLNDHLATAIGKLELIKIKHRLSAKPFSDEMNYLINMAQKALDANL